jgi:hypothetical protein
MKEEEEDLIWKVSTDEATLLQTNLHHSEMEHNLL